MFEQRLLRVFLCLALLFLAIVLRAFDLQVLRASEFASRSASAGSPVLPRRGPILYADGSPMVANESRWRVLLDTVAFFAPHRRCRACGDVRAATEEPVRCAECQSSAGFDLARTPDVAGLARLTGRTPEEMAELLGPAVGSRGLRWITLLDGRRRLDREQALAIALRASEFPGLEVRSDPAREADPAVASLTGAAVTATREDVERLTSAGRDALGLPVLPDDVAPRILVGRRSLEARYDESLRGSPGRVLRLPSRTGGLSEAVVLEEVEDGRPLRTTIRRDVQECAFEIVQRAKDAEASAAVVLSVTDGSVVALASRSSDGINHAVAPRDPGSVYKLVTALAALRGGIDPLRTTHCAKRGKLPGGQPYTCTGTHGDADFVSAFAGSCNPYFQQCGLDLGGPSLADAAGRLGVAASFDLGIFGERAALTGPWTRSDAFHVSIGQGRVLASPLHVAVAYARVASGGRTIVPWLDRDAGAPAACRTVDPEIARHAELLRRAAEAVVDAGTASRVPGLAELRAAGKSGTAETSGKTSNNAWFVAWAPREAPLYVAVVVHEKVAEHGARMAGPDVAALLGAALR